MGENAVVELNLGDVKIRVESKELKNTQRAFREIWKEVIGSGIVNVPERPQTQPTPEPGYPQEVPETVPPLPAPNQTYPQGVPGMPGMR